MSEPIELLCGPAAGPDAFSDAFSRVPAEVLETMFFAEAEPACCEHAWLPSAEAVCIGFDGSHTGVMRLCVSREAADSIASAFLGLEPMEITEALAAQVILELANILCGAILSHAWPESKLALSPPQVCAGAPEYERAEHHCFEMPEGKLAVWVHWSEAAGPVEG